MGAELVEMGSAGAKAMARACCLAELYLHSEDDTEERFLIRADRSDE